jgi:hypothetical protein
MIDNGRAYAVAVALQHLLRALERKGVMTEPETTKMLDEVVDEIVDLTTQGVLSAEANADARRTIGVLYLPKRPVISAFVP